MECQSKGRFNQCCVFTVCRRCRVSFVSCCFYLGFLAFSGVVRTCSVCSVCSCTLVAIQHTLMPCTLPRYALCYTRMHFVCTTSVHYTVPGTLYTIHYQVYTTGIQYLLHYVGYYVRKRKTPVCFCKAFLPWQVSLPSSCRTCTVVHSLQVTTKTNLLAELKHQAPN